MDEEIRKLMEEIYSGTREPTAVNDVNLQPNKKKALLAVAKLVHGMKENPEKFVRVKATLISVFNTPFADDVDRTILASVRALGS